MSKNKNFKKKLDKLLEIPAEVVSDIPKITMKGFERILIENYKGILEYEEYFVKINVHIGNININGINLNLNEITSEDILVTGNITGVEFENNE